MNDDISAKMKKSVAWQSLHSERQVALSLSKMKWDVVHGSYYKDSDSGKLREIDVIARRSWRRKSKKTEIGVTCFLIAECKSASNYHILAHPIEKGLSSSPHKVWVGEERMNEGIISKVLRHEGVSEDEIARIMTGFKKVAYPDHMIRPYDLVIPPYPSLYDIGSYREHNFGQEKELETSVVWKAHLTLESVIKSFENRAIFRVLEDLPFELEYYRTHSTDIVAGVIDFLCDSVSCVELHHPVVVIDSPIWVIDDEHPQHTPWVRFHRQSSYGNSDWWFDIVSSSSFDTYAKGLTDYYVQSFRNIRAKEIS